MPLVPPLSDTEQAPTEPPGLMVAVLLLPLLLLPLLLPLLELLEELASIAPAPPRLETDTGTDIDSASAANHCDSLFRVGMRCYGVWYDGM